MGAFSAQVLADGAAGYWRCGEASGVTAQDAHPTNNNDATIVGAPTMGVAGGLLTDSDTAFSLNGTSQYLSVLDANPLDLGNTFTLMCLIKRSATGQAGLFSKGNAYRFEIGPAGGSHFLRLRAGAGTIMVTSTVGISDLTKFHLVHALKDSATAARIYIDGVDVSGAFTNVTLADNANALLLGANGAAANFHSGVLDECAVFPTALSAAQIANHWVLARGLGIGIATESDSAITLARTKSKAIGIASESDAGQSASKRKSKAVTRADETDTAQALQRQKQRMITPAIESDVAEALTHQKQRSISPATETDEAERLAAEKHKGISEASETDTAQPLTYQRQLAIAPATEADIAQALARQKVLPISPALEIDEAMVLTIPGRIVLPIGIAQETDTAMPLVQPTQPVVAPQPTGATYISPDLPQRRILIPKVVPIGIASEFNEALALAFERRPSRNQLDEEDLYVIGSL